VNEQQVAALNDFRAAYEFYLQCKRDNTSVETGAWADACEWLRKAQAELYEATHGICL